MRGDRPDSSRDRIAPAAGRDRIAPATGRDRIAPAAGRDRPGMRKAPQMKRARVLSRSSITPELCNQSMQEEEACNLYVDADLTDYSTDEDAQWRLYSRYTHTDIREIVEEGFRILKLSTSSEEFVCIRSRYGEHIPRWPAMTREEIASIADLYCESSAVHVATLLGINIYLLSFIVQTNIFSMSQCLDLQLFNLALDYFRWAQYQLTIMK